MILKEFEVKIPGGVSLRDAQNLVRYATRYESEIFFDSKGRKINAKSLMGVIAMALSYGDKVLVMLKGDDEEAAACEIGALFAGGR